MTDRFEKWDDEFDYPNVFIALVLSAFCWVLPWLISVPKLADWTTMFPRREFLTVVVLCALVLISAKVAGALGSKTWEWILKVAASLVPLMAVFYYNLPNAAGADDSSMVHGKEWIAIAILVMTAVMILWIFNAVLNESKYWEQTKKLINAGFTPSISDRTGLMRQQENGTAGNLESTDLPPVVTSFLDGGATLPIDSIVQQVCGADACNGFKQLLQDFQAADVAGKGQVRASIQHLFEREPTTQVPLAVKGPDKCLLNTFYEFKASRKDLQNTPLEGPVEFSFSKTPERYQDSDTTPRGGDTESVKQYAFHKPGKYTIKVEKKRCRLCDESVTYVPAEIDVVAAAVENQGIEPNLPFLGDTWITTVVVLVVIAAALVMALMDVVDDTVVVLFSTIVGAVLGGVLTTAAGSNSNEG